MDKSKKPLPVLPPQPDTGSRFAKDNDPVFEPIKLDDGQSSD